MDIGLLLIRLSVGLTLAAHGTEKLFGWFGGPGLEGTAQHLTALGFLPGRRHALMAGLTEAGGGFLLALGLLTPVAATLVFAVMLVAGLSVHARQGFFPFERWLRVHPHPRSGCPERGVHGPGRLV